MKQVNFNMKQFIDDVDISKGKKQFEEVTKIYTDNEPDIGTKIYGNKFWRNKVNATCKQLEKLKRQKDYTSIVVESKS